jgi:hypothetical protein
VRLWLVCEVYGFLFVLRSCTYVDEEAGVLQRGLLADLLHYFGLCVGGHFGWSGGGVVWVRVFCLLRDWW